MPASGEPCGSIEKIANEFRAALGQDSLYVFLCIHHCICLKASSSPRNPIQQLNACFAEKCAGRIENCRAGRADLESISERWKRALVSYLNDRFDFSMVLPRFAIAHICDDLPDALMEVKRSSAIVTREMYNEVLDDILDCVNQAYSRPPLSASWRDKFLHDLFRYSGAQKELMSEFRAFAWRKAIEREALGERLRELLGPPK
ncbi:MAG TPA: hypothetical protein VEX69_07630 [Candidatus Limnocylindria bacterium]|nr:hypothetical protein [Candidatus Limnocylindria bacterium]